MYPFPKSLTCIIVFLLVCFSGFSKEADQADQFKYCIAFKHSFEAWGDCNNGRPKFVSAKLSLKIGDVSKDSITISGDQLNSIIPFKEVFKGSSEFGKSVLGLKFGDEALEKLTINTKAKDIRIDTKLEYESPADKWQNGVNEPVDGSASDPCNWASSEREGYIMSTFVIIDDPVMIAEPLKDALDADRDFLELQFDKFYLDKDHEKAVLQYRPNGEPKWDDLELVVRPGKTAYLFYSQMAGLKSDPKSNYYKWLDKNIALRVKKVLLNDSVSYGNTVEVKFNSSGPRFRVKEVKRSWCDDNPVVDVEFLDQMELAGFDVTKVKWELKNDSVDIMVPCSGSMLTPNTCRLTPTNSSDAEKFKESGGWTIQLQLPDRTDLIFPKDTFTIPDPPVAIDVRQSDPSFPAKDPVYHLLSDKDPYANIKIVDKYARLSYAIYKKDGDGMLFVDSLHSLPSVFSELSETEQEAIYQNFVNKYRFTEKGRRNTNWEKYFNLRFEEWFYQKSQPQRTDISSTTGLSGCNTNFNSLDLFVMSDNAKYLASTYYYNLTKTDGSAGVLELSYNSVEAATQYHDFWKRNAKSDVFSFIGSSASSGHNSTYPGTWLKIDNSGNCESRYYTYEYKPATTWSRGKFHLVKYNGCSIIGRDESNNYYLVGTLGAISSLKAELPGYADGIIGSSGAICAYRNGAGDVLYFYERNNGLRSWPANQITNIRYINTTAFPAYVIYETAAGDKYQQFLLDESNKQQVADHYFTTESLYKDWYDDYVDEQWQLFLIDEYGHKLYNHTKINSEETYYLIGSDNCRVEFPVNVKVPPLPDFTIAATSNPSTNCSSDGVVTLVCTQGELPLSCKSGTINNIGDAITVSGLNWTDEILFRNSDLGVDFPWSVSFTGNPNGIQSVTSESQTCNSPADGSITVHFAPNSTGEKVYRLLDLSSDSVREYSTTLNNYTFSGLKGGRQYQVFVVVDSCELEWPGTVTVEREVFSISSTVSDATEIGGVGSATIQVDNLPSDAVWTGGTFDEGSTFKSFSPGKHVIVASHGGCTTQTEFEISEPGLTVDIEVLKAKDGFAIAASNMVFNDLVAIGGLEIKDEGGNVFEFNTKLPIDEEYVINFNYNNKVRELYRFSGSSFSQMSLAHDVKLSEQQCPGDEVVATLEPNNPEDSLKANFEGLFDDILTTSTKEASLSYAVQKSKTDTFPLSSGAVNVTLINEEDFVVDIPQVSPVQAVFQFVDVSCYGANDGHISIMNASNGSGSYQWRLGNSDVRKDTFETFGSLSPGAYEVYLRDSGNECPEVKIGTANITEPPVLEVVAKGSIVPICADGTGSVSLSVDGGNEFYKYQLLVNNDSIVAQYPSGGQLDEVSGEEVFFAADSTYEVSGLTAGSYRILVQDVAGCELAESFELPSYQNPTAGQVKVEPAKCFADANGFIELDGVSGSDVLDSLFLTADDGSRMDTLRWPNARFDGLAAGGYSLYLKDKNGCLSDHMRRTVLQPERLEIHEDTIVPVVYTGAETGKIMVHVSGGNNPAFMHARLLEFNAEDGEEVNIVAEREGRITGFEGLRGGTYTLEVRDVKGCFASMSPIKVDEREDALRLEQGVVTDALCNAGVGSLSVEASGGWGGYTYRVLGQGGASKVPTFESLYAGTYLVMVEDSLGAVDSVRVTINEPGLLQARLIDEVLPTCEDNGALTFEVSGGVGPYQMFNEGGTALAGSDSEAFTAPELGVGDYRFTALDANGCRTDFTGSLNGENLLDVSLVAVHFVSSPGAEDGSLRALVKGGVAPYVYRWTNQFEPDLALDAAGDELNGVGSGYYRVLVSEENGCEKSAALLLPDFNDGFMVVDTIGHERGLGASNGFVRLLAQQAGLDSAHVFFPDDSVVRLYGAADGLHEGVLAINGLGGGTYAVVAYGPAGREVVDFEVIAYEPFVFGRVDVSHVSKLGGSDGSMVVSVQGGAPDFTFGWETLDGDSVPVPNGVLGNEGRISGLAAGTYRVRVRDRYDNEINREVEVDEPQSELELVITDSANQSCFNYTDAWVTVEAQGGWGNYHYRHASEPEFLKSFRWSDLPVGEHKFFTMDQKGIVDSVRINITEPDLLQANVALVDSVDCFGGGDGKVYFDVAGGTGPYRYALLEDLPVWSASTGVPATDAGDGLFLFADNLAEGQYVYRFTDANNCVAADTLSVYVPQPNELLFGVVDVVHTTCDTDNGSIEVLMQGGSAPYRYEWTDNSGTVFSSGSSVDGLEQGGHYSLRVWDKNNCTTGLEQTVNASTLPQILQVVTTPVLCFGDSNGKAAVTGVTPAEPFAPYGFEWSNSAEGDSVDGFSSGRHWVTVRDTNGCETTRYFDVASPDTLGLSLVELRDAHCFGYSDGRIEIRPFGGVGDYRFLWSNGADTPAAENLSKGLYTLSFTDANNCLFEESFEINEPPKEVVDVGEDLSMCPGNSIVIDGRDFTAHRWTKGEELLSEERYFMVAAEGEYALRVTNDRGCYAYDTLSVSIGNDALQADFLMTSEAVLGDTLMLFELSNLPLDSLSWAYPDAAFSKELAGEVDDYVLHLKTLDEGMYNVTLYAYSGGCFSRKVKQVEIMADGDVDPEDELLGYQDPLIKRFGVSPNPNDGRFNVDVELREAADIHLAVFGVSMGQKLAERRSSGMETYAESFVLANANTGVYVVVLSAGKERRQVKIVIE